MRNRTVSQARDARSSRMAALLFCVPVIVPIKTIDRRINFRTHTVPANCCKLTAEVMSVERRVDFGRVAEDYANYRDDVPETVIEQLIERGVPVAGAKIADIGAGTGSFSRLLAKRGAQVFAVEPSPELIAQARRLDALHGAHISYVQATAERTTLPEREFDAVTAVRAWHWFDRPPAIREARSILKNGAYLAVIDSVLLPDKSQAVADTFKVIKKHAPGGQLTPPGAMAENRERRGGFPVHWFAEWEAHGLTLADNWQFEYELDFTPESWRGKVRSLSWMTQFDLPTRNEIDREVAELFRDIGGLKMKIPHSCRVALLKN